MVISGLYILSTWTALKPGGSVLSKNLKSAIKRLLWINAAIVLLDLTLLATEYSGHYEIQTLYKAALYSVKLKLELRILNQLVSLTKARSLQQWSQEYSCAGMGSTVHDLHTFSDRDSKGPRMMSGATVLNPDGHGRIRPISVNPTETMISRTAADFERSRSDPDPDIDSDRGRRGSLDITCETIDGYPKTISSSWLGVGLAR